MSRLYKSIQIKQDCTRVYKSIQIKQECTTLSVQRCLEYISKCLQDYWSVTECTECLDTSILYTQHTRQLHLAPSNLYNTILITDDGKNDKI